MRKCVECRCPWKYDDNLLDVASSYGASLTPSSPFSVAPSNTRSYVQEALSSILPVERLVSYGFQYSQAVTVSATEGFQLRKVVLQGHLRTLLPSLERQFAYPMLT